MKSVYYKPIEKYLLENINKKSDLRVLEIGCGSKIYKKLFNKHHYFGLDIPESKWTNNLDKPEIESKLSDYNNFENFDLIFSVASIYLLDPEDFKILIKLIYNLKKTKGKILIFDYKKQTIDKLNNNTNNIYFRSKINYENELKENFKESLKIIDNEWCSNNIFKKKIKEKFKVNKSHILEIFFNN